MPNQASECISIYPKSKKHSRFLMMLGCVFISFSMLLNSFLWSDFKYQLMLVLFASCIVFLTGYLKYTEPEMSYKLSRERLHFYHRNGSWNIAWNEITRIDNVSSRSGLNHIQLPYIGIKLKSIECIAQNISPRLANKLIHEQRDLLVLAARNNEIVLDSGLISFEPFTLNKKTYKGPIAAWLFRTEQLVSIYGYHLFIPETSFDREIDEFVQLLKQCKHHSNNHYPP